MTENTQPNGGDNTVEVTQQVEQTEQKTDKQEVQETQTTQEKSGKTAEDRFEKLRANHKSKMEEMEQKIESLQRKAVAAQYWQWVFEDEKVKTLKNMKKEDGSSLSWEEAAQLANYQPPQESVGSFSIPWRAKVNFDEGKKSYSVSELEDLQANNPTKYQDVMRRYKSWEVTLA